MESLVEPTVHAVDYAIESIIDKRQNRGVIEYLVKWVGFDEGDSTWEPVGNIEGSGDAAIGDYEKAENGEETLGSDKVEQADFILRVGKADAKKHVASGKDGYWNNPRFRHQQYHALTLFGQMMAPLEAELTALHGFDIKFAAVFTLDHSSGHTAMSETALNTKDMTKGSTGKKGSRMHDTVYTDHLCLKSRVGKKYPQKMTKGGVNIGAAQCLYERGWKNAHSMKLSEIVEALGEYDDIKAEKVAGRQVEMDIAEYNKENGRQHKILWVPKFHCELAWIERKWAFLKRGIKKHTTGTMPGLVSAYRKVIQTLTIETCRRFARKARDYIRAYMDGAEETEIDHLVSTKYKSHRCVFDSDLGKLVLKAGRTLTALEEAQAQKTQRTQELREIRKAAMQEYQHNFNLLLRSKERNRKDSCYTRTRGGDLSNATKAIKRMKCAHDKPTPESNNEILHNIPRLTAAKQAEKDTK